MLRSSPCSENNRNGPVNISWEFVGCPDEAASVRVADDTATFDWKDVCRFGELVTKG